MQLTKINRPDSYMEGLCDVPQRVPFINVDCRTSSVQEINPVCVALLFHPFLNGYISFVVLTIENRVCAA